MKLREKSIKHQTQSLPSFINYKSNQLIRKFDIQFVYGHREILLKYSNLDLTSLLTGIIQHGVGPVFTLSSDWPTPKLIFLEGHHYGSILELPQKNYHRKVLGMLPLSAHPGFIQKFWILIIFRLRKIDLNIWYSHNIIRLVLPGIL